MKYAVIRVSGRQYRVSEGDQILIDYVGNEKVKPEVLLVSDGSQIKIGEPVIDKAEVVVKILEEEVKGDKISVFKYKAKSRYRKHTGFRPKYTKILIEKIF